MAKTRSMTREQKRLKTSEEGGSASWSDLFGDLLIIVMMRLGLVDFVSFSGVCKRWRSIAHSQWKTFMGCKVPMCMSFFNSRGFWLEDFAGRRFKTIRRHEYELGVNSMELFRVRISQLEAVRTRNSPFVGGRKLFNNKYTCIANSPGHYNREIVMSPVKRLWV
ncbi:F-box domain-containing protein [Artemisia annua]|uniref:F-box domain-containing protein n=1 Tax=Artemisia annua TaxID=35608 RepID=A0A2U1N989_ARTAN|nr:F-box domain-containing protein [Artemisia annua]